MTHVFQPLNVGKPVALFYILAGSQPPGERRCGGWEKVRGVKRGSPEALILGFIIH